MIFDIFVIYQQFMSHDKTTAFMFPLLYKILAIYDRTKQLNVLGRSFLVLIG